MASLCMCIYDQGPEASVSIYWGNAEGCADQCLIVDMGFFPDWFKRLPKVEKCFRAVDHIF